MAVKLNRRQISQIYRPAGAKIIQTGIAFTPAVGGVFNLGQAVDLTLPILGFRVVISGRDVIGGANMTSVNPEGYLNLLSRILITGTNTRQKGNVTLWDIDFPTAFIMHHLLLHRANQATLQTGGAAVTEANMNIGLPFPAASFGAVAQATYDWQYVLDLLAYPVGCNRAQRVGYAIRAEEWGNSLQMQFTFGAQANGVAGVLGTDAGGSTHVFTGYQSGAGTPTLDVYSLPFEMGLDLKDGVLPGFVTRVTKPVTATLQAALGPNGPIVNLDTQPTSRVFIKVGTATVGNAFATLSDTNLTSVGIMLGGQKVVRAELPLRIHRQDVISEHGTEPIQGYNMLDFIQSGNPDSSYPGQLIQAGTQFQLVGTAAGIANARAHIIQEEPIYAATGPLYTL